MNIAMTMGWASAIRPVVAGRARKATVRWVLVCRRASPVRSPCCPRALRAGNTAVVAAKAIIAMGNCWTRVAK